MLDNTQLTTALLGGGWVPETFRSFLYIGSQLLDGDFSHCWQILATQQGAPTQERETDTGHTE